MQIPSNSNGAAQAGTPNSNSATLTCTSCGDENALDSRFCRHCGAILRPTPAVPATPTAAAIAQPVAPAVDPVVLAVTSDAHEAAAIDKRRARQLLDRAFGLAERGDVASAILACRQSVALDPEAPQGFSMLGLLLERAGSLEEAAAAYRKVLHLAPESRLEADSLARLQATLTQRKGGSGFHFDEKKRNSSKIHPPPL